MGLLLRNIIFPPCPVDGSIDRTHRLLHPLHLRTGRTINVLFVLVMKFGIFLPIGVVAYSNLEPFCCRSIRILRLLKFNPGLLRREFFSRDLLNRSVQKIYFHNYGGTTVSAWERPAPHPRRSMAMSNAILF